MGWAITLSPSGQTVMEDIATLFVLDCDFSEILMYKMLD